MSNRFAPQLWVHMSFRLPVNVPASHIAAYHATLSLSTVCLIAYHFPRLSTLTERYTSLGFIDFLPIFDTIVDVLSREDWRRKQYRARVYFFSHCQMLWTPYSTFHLFAYFLADSSTSLQMMISTALMPLNLLQRGTWFLSSLKTSGMVQSILCYCYSTHRYVRSANDVSMDDLRDILQCRNMVD